MSTTFPLPLECLQQIIRHAASRADGNTLVALLCVNKYVFSATLPILYENPCRFRPSILGNNPKNLRALESIMKLVELLLLSIPKDHITSLLRDAYLPSQKDEQYHQTLISNATIAPYFAFVTNLSFETHVEKIGSIFNNQIIIRRLGLDRMTNEEIKSLYLAEEVFWSYSQRRYKRTLFGAGCAISQKLRRELVFAFVNVGAEQLQSLDIPISDISAYLPLISRLKSLVNVRFLLDRELQNKARPYLKPEEELILRKQDDKRIQDLETMILFVQEHRRIHPNVLNMARCESVATFQEYCPEEFFSRLIQSLPPLRQPKFLDKSNWLQFITYFQDTDLSRVNTITIPSSTMTSLPNFTIQDPFLQRCRSLQSLDIASWDENLFQWAVEEQRIYTDTIAKGGAPQQSLVPIKHLEILYPKTVFGQQINDVLFGFRRTLESIKIQDMWESSTNTIAQHDFILGGSSQCWSLPQLRDLEITFFQKQRLNVHPELLSHCPQLIHVNLSDLLEEYRLEEIDYWAPASLPDLETLYLEGTPTISFHPNTLHTTPKLRELSLEMFSSNFLDSAFIPPLEELASADESARRANEAVSSLNPSAPTPRSRPVWTWDWDLPNLVHLSLKAEFAYRFQFKMLDKTPNLEFLSLSTVARSGDYKRIIEIIDLIKPGFQHPSLSSFLDRERNRPSNQKIYQQFDNLREGINASKSMGTEILSSRECILHKEPAEEEEEEWIRRDIEYIQLPKLKTLRLDGSWLLEQKASDILYEAVAPAIISSKHQWISQTRDANHSY
ncbi:hypothetical protein FBU30_007802 [Linnemannia zychae]|nr:hypothetical protein FBU30_007802 [Linnemannia zychae]